MRTRIRRALAAALLTVTTAAAGLTGAAPAGAAVAVENAADITGIRPPAKVVIESTACRNIPVTFTGAVAPNWEFWGADVEVRRNGVLHDTMFPSIPVAGGSSLETYFWCPSFDGPGTFQFGGSYVVGWDTAGATDVTFRDETAARVKVGLGSKATLSGKRSGGKVTFTARTSRFTLSAGMYRPWTASKVVLQRQRPDGSWANWKTIAYTSRGVATATFTASAGRYRAVAPGTPSVWQATSKGVRL